MNAPQAVCQDLLSVDSVGKEKFEDFVEKLLKNQETSFHLKIKRNSIKTFETLHKKIKVSSTNKGNYNIRAQRNIFGQLPMLSLKHNIHLEKVMSFPVSLVPFDLGTTDDLPMKTDKRVLLHLMNDSTCEVEKNKGHRDDLDTCVIIGGNTLLYTLSHNCETFGDLAIKVFSKLPDEKKIRFITDAYK